MVVGFEQGHSLHCFHDFFVRIGRHFGYIAQHLDFAWRLDDSTVNSAKNKLRINNLDRMETQTKTSTDNKLN